MHLRMGLCLSRLELIAPRPLRASVVALTSDVRGVCCWWVWLVVRFVCVPLCVRVFRVSRVCPVFTGTIVTHSVGGCTCTRADARAGVIRGIHGRRAQ
jgi:hypothetical protein